MPTRPDSIASPGTRWLALTVTLAAAAACGGGSTDDSELHGDVGGNSQAVPQGAGGSSTTVTRRFDQGGATSNGHLGSGAGAGTSFVTSQATGGLGSSAASSQDHFSTSPSGEAHFGGAGGSDSVTAIGTALGGSGATSSTNPLNHGSGGTTSGTSPLDHGSGGKATSATGGSSSTSALLVPDSGALLGLYYGDADIAATEKKLGCSVPLHLTYYAWEDDWTEDITPEDLRAGRIPFVNWELFGANLDDIVAGKNDTMIRQRAVAAKKLSGKLFVDFGAEMNGDWSPWSGAQNGKSADKYVAAYRHVHDLFVESAATNVIWAFCPNVTSEPDEDWNEPLDYYPGDGYVDWMCVDGYNWGTSDTWGAWQSFREVFEDIYPVLAAKQKPILIGEMASTELGGDKAEWIRQIIPTLKNDYPMIKGLVWFDIDKETDWRISSSPSSESAFKAMANDPFFKR